MKTDQDKLFAFEYQGGRDVTDRLLKIMNAKDFQSLAEMLNIPKATISTWHSRNQTPFEIAVRIHLKTGVSLQWLLLGEGEMYVEGQSCISSSNDRIELSYSELKNGELINKDKLSFDPVFLEGMPEAKHLMLVEYEGHKLFVDTSKTKAISGKYMINIDGDVSINSMQKLPGNMVAIEFSQSTVQLNENEIKVLGRIVQL